MLLEELAAFLKTFRGLTELVSTKTTSLSLIPLLRAEVTDACIANSTDDDDSKTIKSMIKRNVDKRLPLTHSVKIATLLDPSTRELLQLSDDVMEDMPMQPQQLIPVLSLRSLTAVTSAAALQRPLRPAAATSTYQRLL